MLRVSLVGENPRPQWHNGTGGPQPLIRRLVFLPCAKSKGGDVSQHLCWDLRGLLGVELPFLCSCGGKDRVEEIAPGSLTRKEQLPDRVQPEKRLSCCGGIIHSGLSFLGRTSNVPVGCRSSD